MTGNIRRKGSDCMERQKYYICIDLKSFYASVECVERNLDPFQTNLVVADPTRSKSTICLAITPAMKRLGVKNRCRIHEIPEKIEYITAMPRMQLYLEYSARIYSIYLRYVSREDIHIYSVDECFIDVSEYLRLYQVTPKEMAVRLMSAVMEETGITATAGVEPTFIWLRLLWILSQNMWKITSVFWMKFLTGKSCGIISRSEISG